MKVPRKDPHDFLESMIVRLLDTLCNVIGLLVLVAVATQISVGEVVRKIEEKHAGKKVADQEPPEIAPQALAKMRQELQELEDQLASLAKTKEPNAKGSGAASDLDRLDQLLKQIKVRQQQLAQGQKSLQEAQKRLKNVETEWTTLQPNLPAATEVSLPNPRPVPKGLKAALFFCRQGKIHPADPVPLLNEWEARLKKINNGQDRVPREESERIVAALDKEPLEDHWFSVKTMMTLDRTFVFLDPKLQPRARDGQGETLIEMRQRTSEFAHALKSLDPTRHYVLFRVWPDSFDIFIEARTLVERQNLPTAWQPFDIDQDWIAYAPGTGGKAPEVD
jgi:hypothetical protein